MSLCQGWSASGAPSRLPWFLLRYTPPKQLSPAHGEVGPACDVYALGATLYCLLTGRPPFLGSSIFQTFSQTLEQDVVSPRALNTGVPPDLEAICLRGLEKRPERRYPSADALADELDRFLQEKPIQTPRLGVGRKLRRWCCRQPVLAGTAGILLLALLGALAIAVVRNHEMRQQLA